MKKLAGVLSLFAGVFAMAAPVQFALVDVGPDGQRVETGGVGLPGAPAINSNGFNSYDSGLSLLSDTGATFGVSISNFDASGASVGGVDWRDRGNGSGDSLVALGEDFVKNNGGVVRLTFAGLPLGLYDVISYHSDPSFDQSGFIQIFADSGGGFVNTGATGNADFTMGGAGGLTTAEVDATSASFSFFANGINDVAIVFDGRAFADTETPLSGLNLTFTAVPEPSTMVLVGLSLVAFVVVRRRQPRAA